MARDEKWSRSVVVDLDGVICKPNLSVRDVEGRYGEARPNAEIIAKLSELKRRGFYIVVHTARRMVTRQGDVSAVKAEVGKLTIAWLRKHGVPFDQLVFGKPYASSYYVDDKAMRPDEFLEHDFSDEEVRS